MDDEYHSDYDTTGAAADFAKALTALCDQSALAFAANHDNDASAANAMWHAIAAELRREVEEIDAQWGKTKKTMLD